MDDPTLDAGEHSAALLSLRRVHWLSGTVGRLWQPIERLIANHQLSALSIMDVGCGDGHVLRQIWRLARGRGCDLQLHGCDFSSRALDFCRAACEQHDIPINLHQVDVLQQPLPGPVDIVINSLFLHHFSDDHVVPLIKQMAARASRLMLIEDLLRSRLSYYLVWFGVRLLTRCRVVHCDGPLSVEAAFSQQEMRNFLDCAELKTASLQKHWPERLFITWEAPAQQTVTQNTNGNVSHAR